MNQMMTGTVDVTVDLPKQVDPEVAADIVKESVFVSPHLERITVSDCFKQATLHIRDAE